MGFLYQIQRRLPTARRPFVGLATIIPFGLAALVLFFLVTSFDIDLSGTWERLKASNFLLFALALLVHYTTFIFRGARWRVLLQNVQPDKKRVPGVLYCARLTLLAWFFNSLVWFRLGDAYRAYAYAGDTSESFSRTMGTVLAERVMDVTMVFLLVVTGALLLVVGGTDASWLFVVAAAFLVATIVGLLAMAFFRRRLVPRQP